MTTRHISAEVNLLGPRAEIIRGDSDIHASRHYVPDDQARSRRIHNFNRCGKSRFAEVSVVPVIDVYGGVAIKGRRELSLLQEQTRFWVEEEHLPAILAGYWNYV